jgi:hypothetical protein
MKNVHALLHGLSKAEQSIFKQQLAVVSLNHLGKDNKLLRLTKYLLSKKLAPGVEECSAGVYGKGSSGKKIFNLVNRLKGKVLEMLICDQALESNEWLDEQDLLAIRVKKRIAQFQVLFFSGNNRQLAAQILDESISVCKENEYYGSLLECLKYKKWMTGYRQGEKSFNELSDQIAHYEHCNKLLSNAADTYYKVIMRNSFSSVPHSKEKFRTLVSAINNLKRDLANVHSPMIEYYLKLLEIDYFQERDEYLKARSECLQLLTVIRGNRSVFRKSRISSAYGNLSRCELYLKRFEEATEFAREAQKHLPVGSANMMVSKEQEFYALFYSGNFPKAHKMALHLSSGCNLQLGDFRYDKYNFFLACTLFMEKKYHQALRILDAYQEITKDKAGWEVAIRLLRIMCCVETSNLDGAIMQIESFRKHISAHSSKTLLNSRHQIILRLLSIYEREGFSLKNPNLKTKDLLNLLRSSNTFYSWEMLGPELIPFHEWFASKIEEKVKRPAPSTNSSYFKVQ